jgi:hypothetical protein
MTTCERRRPVSDDDPTTCVLDELIKPYPQRLELFRTRGIVLTFRDEYSAAVKDFTHALKEASMTSETLTATPREDDTTTTPKKKKKEVGQVQG